MQSRHTVESHGIFGHSVGILRVVFVEHLPQLELVVLWVVLSVLQPQRIEMVVPLTGEFNTGT